MIFIYNVTVTKLLTRRTYYKLYCPCYSSNAINEKTLNNFCSYVTFVNSKINPSERKTFPSQFLEAFGGNIKSCYRDIYSLNETIGKLSLKCQDLNDLRIMLSADVDKELKTAAKEEQQCLKNHIIELRNEFVDSFASMYHPAEEVYAKGETVIEVYAGVGGLETMLFAAEIYNMYKNLCFHHGYEFTQLEYDKESSGIHKAAASIKSDDNDDAAIYNLLKYEGGIHRVQRCPATEKRGRIHTSTASVAVLQSPPAVEKEFDERDLIIKPVRKAAGKGGQHVNKVESAIRVTHIPSGKYVILRHCVISMV